MLLYDYLDTPIGILEIACDENYIYGISFTDQRKKPSSSLLSKQAKHELKEYFEGRRTAFSLPLRLEGTPFQKEVWKALYEIPYARTCSYKDIAVKIGRPGAARAVGQACNKNPIAIVIPCHRVIGSSKKLVGYAGGPEKKLYLLNLEQNLLKLSGQ